VRLLGALLPALLALLALTGLRAHALAGPPPPLSEFIHVSRTVDEGAPADVWTLAIGPAGDLWLGTGFGLYRFDGLRFERYPLREGQRLRSTNINAMTVLPDGDVWLGLYAGGVLRLHDGQVTPYGPAEGLPPGRVLHFARTADGSLWAAAGTGLARFHAGRWQRIGADWGYEAAGADYVFVDSHDVLWVAGRGVLSFLRPGERRFTDTGERPDREPVLAEDARGRVWVSDDRLGTRPLPDYPGGAQPAKGTTALPAPEVPPYGRAKQMLFASDGSLWLTQYGTGVRRLREPAHIPTGQALTPADALETFSAREGLPSNQTVPLAEDGQGHVWAGTNVGLASFRRRQVQVLEDRAGIFAHTNTVTPWGQGVLTSTPHAVLQLDPPGLPVLQPNTERLSGAIHTPEGALWRMQAGGLWREWRGRQQRLATLGEQVLAFASDGEGGAWVSMNDFGVLRVQDGGVTPEPRALADGAPPTVIARRGPDDIWFGHDDQIVRLHQGQVSRYTQADGLRVGRTSAILFGRRAVYVAGETGLARFDGRRFTSVSAEQDDALSHVTGMLETEDGTLWLNGGRGVVQVRGPDVGALFQAGTGHRAYRLLDWRHGLPGVAQQASYVPTLVRDTRGRLWFNTNRGLAWLNPDALARPEPAPAVGIRGLRAGERLYLPSPALALPRGTRNIVLQYTAFSLANAERTRFRYRLQGVDGDWQDGGMRREASYANLRDGDYVFEVSASNGDGTWSEHPAELHFSIAPTFAQSRWFGVSAAALALALTWLGYALRTRAIARRVRLLLEERHAERERIARELHDTLLQSTQGLIINVQGLVARLPQQDSVRAEVEALLDRADDVVLEARDRVRGLRIDEANGIALAQALEALGRELAADTDVIFRVVSSGTPKALRPEVSDELFCIGREALLNAFRHAGARQIEVEVDYGATELSLNVRDDGVGIPAEVLEQGGRPGHWGLPGMRERVAVMGGRLRLSSEVPAGTEIGVSVAAASAYAEWPADGLRMLRWGWLRRKLGAGWR
jgi:signal transduction histidine kinase/ligand-binding sensor domain-containing protein